MHLTTNIGEYAIILNEKNEFLMLQWPTGEWHFPGGRVDEGEDAVEGLHREIFEETGLHITDLKPVFTKVFSTKTKNRRYGVFFTAKATSSNITLCTDHTAYKWYSKKDISDIIFWQPFYKDMLEKVL